MNKLNRRIATGFAAVATGVVTVMAMSSPASAATLNVNFEGNGIDFTAVQANQTLSCPQFDLAGTFDDVTNSGQLPDLTASGCTNPIAGSTSVVPNGVWQFDKGASLGGTLFAADITAVTATVSAVGCTFDVAGSVTGQIDTSNQTFTVDTSNVQISSVPQGGLTCILLGVAQGQDIAIDGSWTNTGDAI